MKKICGGKYLIIMSPCLPLCCFQGHDFEVWQIVQVLFQPINFETLLHLLGLKFTKKKYFCSNCSGATSLAIHQTKWLQKCVSRPWPNPARQCVGPNWPIVLISLVVRAERGTGGNKLVLHLECTSHMYYFF